MSDANTLKSPSVKTLVDVLTELNNNGDKPALINVTDATLEQTSRHELHELITRIAGGLAARGIKKGDRVIACSSASMDWIAAALATIKLGAVIVPLDAQIPDRDLTHVIRDSRPPSCSPTPITASGSSSLIYRKPRMLFSQTMPTLPFCNSLIRPTPRSRFHFNLRMQRCSFIPLEPQALLKASL